MLLVAIHQVAVLSIGCVGACAVQNPLATPPERGELSLSAPVVTDSACRSLAFDMGNNNAPASSSFPNFDNCAPGGLMLAAVPNGTVGLAMPRRISITLRIRNRTTSDVSVPMRLVLPKSGIVVIGGGASTKVTPSAPDSLRADGTGVWLVGGDGLIRHPGDSTAPKTIILNVGNPVQGARLNFQILAGTTNSVPPTAPDSTPAWFVDDSSWTAYRILKRVAEIDFIAGTNVAQRQAAIDSVGGTVIGGYRLPNASEGTYYVLIPAAVNDSMLVVALKIISRQPGVRNAGVHFRLTPSGLRPGDGPGWARSDWSFDKDQSNGENWNFEELAFPLAWGCHNRAETTHVGVLEKRITGGEYAGNAHAFSPSLPLPGGQFEENHGRNIADILAAVGDNGSGITGVLWSAAIDIVTEASTLATPLTDLPLDYGLDSLVRLGASVINLSQEANRVPNPSLDSILQKNVANRILNAIHLNGPLLILAAGNDNDSVSTRSTGIAAAQLPQNILLVGGSGPRNGQQRDRWGGSSHVVNPGSGSNWGTLIDVYAPATGVYGFDAAGQWQPLSGTSYAAPLVTGLAALLKGFDPRLTAQEIKVLIIDGAQAGSVSMLNDPGKFLANAFESLKLAAQRTGAPLCGNHVWVDNLQRIVIDRGSFTETAYTLPAPDTLGLTFTRHGGRRIDFQVKGGGSQYWGLDYVGPGWMRSAAAAPLPDSARSGTTWSFFQDTHDGDSTVRTSSPSFGGHEGETAAHFDVYVEPRLSSGRRNLVQDMTLGLLAANYVVGKHVAQTDSVGNFIQYNDVPSIRVPNGDYQTILLRPLPTPFGDRALLVINYLLTTVSGGHWAPDAGSQPIGSEWSYEVWTTNTNTVSQSVHVWTIPWAGGSAAELWMRPDSAIGWMGVSEALMPNGTQEAVIGVGRKDHAAAQPFVQDYVDCRVEYLNVLSGVDTSSRAAPPVTCGVGQIELGTFAPIRAPLTPQKPLIPKHARPPTRP